MELKLVNIYFQFHFNIITCLSDYIDIKSMIGKVLDYISIM